MVARLSIVTALVISAVGLSAPAARADVPWYECTLRAVTVHPGSGWYSGVLAGYVVHVGDRYASIRCYIQVDGYPQPQATTGEGMGVAVDPVSFGPVTRTSVVEVCAVARTVHGLGPARCGGATIHQPLPDEVWDVIDTIGVQVTAPA